MYPFVGHGIKSFMVAKALSLNDKAEGLAIIASSLTAVWNDDDFGMTGTRFDVENSIT